MGDTAFLLVDDEKTVLDGLKNELRRMFGPRYLYEIAESVPEAWEVIDELSEDGVRIVVVVSDWLMPEIKGDEFLVELKQKHPTTVRIMLTGHAAADAVRRLKDLNAAHSVIAKPWDAAELKAVIENALSR